MGNLNQMKNTFTDYSENSLLLFKMLFGAEMFEKLSNTKLKDFNWEGLEITCPEILATTLNIQERFETESDKTLLELFIQTVYHYGYQQCVEINKPTMELLLKIKEFK